MSTPVEKIKDRIGIEEVVGAYVELKEAGSYKKGLCPFHKEKTPSFTVSPDRNTFYCFGCGAKGDIFTFVQLIEGLDFSGSLKLLAERTGVDIKEGDPSEGKEKERVLQALEQAAVFFENKLKEQTEALDYLTGRGVRPPTVSRWRLGYAPMEWRWLKDQLEKQGFTEKELSQAGLIKQKNNRFFDTFRQRIMFPITDSSGRVIAFSGRLFPDDGQAQAPKYLNSPDSLVFNKSEAIYGLQLAKHSIRSSNYSVLVEGQFDLIMSHQAGVRNTVAASGTALTPAHLKKLKRLSSNIIVAFDSDEAGLRAAHRVAALALAQDMEVKIVDLPVQTDPADIILENVRQWSRVLSGAWSAIDFFTKQINDQSLERLERVKRLKAEIFPLLRSISSNMNRLVWIEKIADQFGLTADVISKDLESSGLDNRSETITQEQDSVTEVKPVPSGVDPFSVLVAIYKWQQAANLPKVKISDLDRRLEERGLLTEIKEANSQVEEDLVFNYEVALAEADEQLLLTTVDELALYYKIKSLEKDFQVAQVKLQSAEREGDDRALKENLELCQSISGRLESLKQEHRNLLK